MLFQSSFSPWVAIEFLIPVKTGCAGAPWESGTTVFETTCLDRTPLANVNEVPHPKSSWAHTWNAE